ncbi:MAG: hypothetical protein IKS03_02215 [Ruminococcus sp.]|nr:hypothetical protein [Ruminococcus sp.]
MNGSWFRTAMNVLNHGLKPAPMRKNLVVNDKENDDDWSICNDFNVGSKVYGDREITIMNLPSNLVNAETVRTACDSKMYTDNLAVFTANSDITVYAAVDKRVNSNLEWLKSWTRTSTVLNTSNGVELELFRLNAKSGETIILGTNGGENESANYIVFVLPQEAYF